MPRAATGVARPTQVTSRARMARVTLALAAVLGAATLGGCSVTTPIDRTTSADHSATAPGAATSDPATSSSATSSPAASKTGDGTVRTDLEPLTTRFPALGAPVSAQWSSGSMGDGRVPGPSTYWIDAVVVVTPEVASRLAGMDLTAAPVPDLVAEVAPVVLPGQALASEALRAAFALPDWTVQVSLIEGTQTVVISALGGS